MAQLEERDTCLHDVARFQNGDGDWDCAVVEDAQSQLALPSPAPHEDAGASLVHLSARRRQAVRQEPE